jgi:hypothetical protein
MTADTITHGHFGADHPARIASDCKHCQRIVRLTRGFREFGYKDLSLAETRDAYNLAMEREVTAEDGIIAMLTRSQLREAGLV